MTAVRIFAVGGLISYRALFYWLTPMIYIPSLVVAPIFQILLMAYIGRSAGLASDEFYVVGNAIQYAAVPCLFAMMQLVGGEKLPEHAWRDPRQPCSSSPALLRPRRSGCLERGVRRRFLAPRRLA